MSFGGHARAEGTGRVFQVSNCSALAQSCRTVVAHLAPDVDTDADGKSDALSVSLHVPLAEMPRTALSR